LVIQKGLACLTARPYFLSGTNGQALQRRRSKWRNYSLLFLSICIYISAKQKRFTFDEWRNGFMINKKIEAAINEQIKNEFYSAYLYLSMAAYCESINFPGFAHWMHLQYEEENAHALRLFHFLNDRGGRVRLMAIDEPASEFESPLALFEQVLAHEQKVTGMIHDLYALAVKENDYPTQVEMQWFISEQVEEEKNAGDIVEQIKMAENNKTALLMLDRELGARQPEGGE